MSFLRTLRNDGILSRHPSLSISLQTPLGRNSRDHNIICSQGRPPPSPTVRVRTPHVLVMCYAAGQQHLAIYNTKNNVNSQNIINNTNLTNILYLYYSTNSNKFITIHFVSKYAIRSGIVFFKSNS